MEFLTYGYKISLILSNKYASRKLMNFVNWHKASYLKWVSFEFSKSIVFFKNRVYYIKNFFFSFFDIDQQLLKKSCFSNLKFGGMYFNFLNLLKLCPIFIGPTLCQLAKYLPQKKGFIPILRANVPWKVNSSISLVLLVIK